MPGLLGRIGTLCQNYEDTDTVSFLGLQAIGRAYLDYLLEEGHFAEAVKMCSKILGKRKDLWEEEIYKFAKIGQLRVR